MMTSHAGIVVRSGVIEDLPVLIDLQRPASIAGYPEPVRSVLAANPALIDQSFRPEWFTGDHVRVAIDGEEGIAGFAVLAQSGDETELVALFVDPGHWKRGIGRSLIEAAAKLASEWGETEIFVLANPLALGFYTSVGFVHDRYVDMRNAPAVPRMILKKPRPLSADD